MQMPPSKRGPSSLSLDGSSSECKMGMFGNGTSTINLSESVVLIASRFMSCPCNNPAKEYRKAEFCYKCWGRKFLVQPSAPPSCVGKLSQSEWINEKQQKKPADDNLELKLSCEAWRAWHGLLVHISKYSWIPMQLSNSFCLPFG